MKNIFEWKKKNESKSSDILYFFEYICGGFYLLCYGTLW